MSFFDYLSIGVILLFVIIGFFRGFIKELFHILALVGGVVGAFLTYDWFFQKMSLLHLVASPHARTILAFAAGFLCIGVTIMLIGIFLSKVVEASMVFNWIDKIFGGVIGAGKAALLLWIFVLSVSFFPSGAKEKISPSIAYRYLSKIPFKLKIPDSIDLKKKKKAQPSTSKGKISA